MKTKTKLSFRDFLSKYSRILILLLICIVLTFASPNFLTGANIMNVLRQSSLYLVMSLGMLFPMLLGRGVDMSTGATLALTSCIGASIMQADINDPAYVILGVAVAIILSILIGALNGVMVAYFALPGTLVTLGMREVIRGIAYYTTSEKVIVLLPRFITYLGKGRVFGVIPMPIMIAAVFVILSVIILNRTRIGRSIYLTGSNPECARFSGISTKAVIIFAFVIAAVFSAVAGLVFIGRLAAAEPSIGIKYSFECVSIVAIGGASFNGGKGNPWGTIVGALILSLLLNALNLLNISAYWQQAVNGIVVIAAVLLDFYARKKST